MKMTSSSPGALKVSHDNVTKISQVLILALRPTHCEVLASYPSILSSLKTLPTAYRGCFLFGKRPKPNSPMPRLAFGDCFSLPFVSPVVFGACSPQCWFAPRTRWCRAERGDADAFQKWSWILFAGISPCSVLAGFFPNFHEPCAQSCA